MRVKKPRRFRERTFKTRSIFFLLKTNLVVDRVGLEAAEDEDLLPDHGSAMARPRSRRNSEAGHDAPGLRTYGCWSSYFLSFSVFNELLLTPSWHKYFRGKWEVAPWRSLVRRTNFFSRRWKEKKMGRNSNPGPLDWGMSLTAAQLFPEGIITLLNIRKRPVLRKYYPNRAANVHHCFKSFN